MVTRADKLTITAIAGKRQRVGVPVPGLSLTVHARTLAFPTERDHLGVRDIIVIPALPLPPKGEQRKDDGSMF